MGGRVFLATVCLEPNRWTADRNPSLRVSGWRGRIAAGGFDGIELWADHAQRADNEERRSLARREGPPIVVLNAYDSFEASSDSRRGRDGTVALMKELDVEAVKFNIGKDIDRKEEYLQELGDFLARLPSRKDGKPMRAFCECHAGTAASTPGAASEMAARMDDPRLGFIIHPFNEAEDSIREWFARYGNRIVHAHLQSREGPLSGRREWVAGRLGLLETLGYRGDFTIEFVAGTGGQGENPEDQYLNALQDLECLKSVLNSRENTHG